ncbi:hypothetical protein Hypma_013120 [Hypsizygus marmoreus]|uniref:Uncharacterized protein n=1 Tax=Hypsizygus marmoreus TaxID=39966 RepID=A0A369JF08_HYPMA|nr:hypothetical protein Hypma_013120 [Hypsizygus marmoreus]
MSYLNPLHPPVTTAHRSQFSSLGGAVHGSSPSTFLSPFRRRLPQAPYTPSSKWRNATGRLNEIHSAITFDFIGYSRQGVPMRELSTRSANALSQMIQGAEDHVLAHTGLARITLRILWPGYEHIEWARSVELTVHGPITRSQLGAAISMNFARFIEKNRSETARSSEWHIGPNGIRFEHLVLISLCNVFEDVWQADVAVDLR